jgi:hypothetical protein
MSRLPLLKSLLIIVFFSQTMRVVAPSVTEACILAPEPDNPYEKLIRAVIQVESKGDTLAFNMIEEANGAFQIRPIRIRDYNQRTGNNYKLENCSNYELSKRIFLYYANRIGFRNYESIARNWNGSGKTTSDYWEKVKKFL